MHSPRRHKRHSPGCIRVQASLLVSGAVASTSAQPEAARAFLAYLNSPATAAVKQRHGMSAVEG